MACATEFHRVDEAGTATEEEAETETETETEAEACVVDDHEAPHETRPRLYGASMSSTLRWYGPPRRKYTRRELLADRIINFGGVGVALCGVPLLVLLSWTTGDSFAKQVGFWAFGFGLILMLSCSALYHHLSWRWDISSHLLALDHIGISSMIMGAYVPVMQMVAGWIPLAIVLSLGLLGWLIEVYKYCASMQHLSSKDGFSFIDSFQIVRYLVMGWACIPFIESMWRSLPREASILYAIGGVTYSLGVVAFVQTETEFHLAIWHFAVLVASASIFAATLQLVGLPLPE